MNSAPEKVVQFFTPRRVFALALALRLSLFLFSGPWKDDWPLRLTYIGDPWEFATLGRSLLTRGEFSLTWPAPLPNALRLPVYPVFIALTSGGAHLDMLWLTILCQIVLDSLFAVFLIHALRVLFHNASLGRIAGILYACNPDAVLWSTQLLAESISVWLIGGALYGLGAVRELAQGGAARGRFFLGVFCAALLPICKPVWQYLWMLFLGWLVCMMFRTRSRMAAAWLLAGCFSIAGPGVAWMVRNYEAWGIFSLSASKNQVQREIAEGILHWAGAKEAIIPKHTYEMRMHLLGGSDFLRPKGTPGPLLEVTTWDPQGMAVEARNSQEFFARTRRTYWPVYLKQYALGTPYLLLSPGTNFVQRFMGNNPLDEESFGHMADSDLGTKDNFLGFLGRSLARPAPVVWTLAVLGYLAFYYLASIAGIMSYWKQYRWHIWTLYLAGAGALVFVLGPVGSAKYRFVPIQAFLPLACLGIMRWQEYRAARRPPPAK